MKFNYDGFEDCLVTEYEGHNGPHWVFKLTKNFGASVIEENEYQHMGISESLKDRFEIALLYFIGDEWHVTYSHKIKEFKHDVAHFRTQDETIELLNKIKNTMDKNRS